MSAHAEQATTIGVSCGHRVPRTPVVRDGRKLYWCEDCGDWRMSGGKPGSGGHDYLRLLRELVDESETPIVVDAAEPITRHGQRLLDTLGVPVAQKRDVATRRATTSRASTVPAPLRLPDNSEIVFVAGVEQLWHLPKAGEEQMCRPTLCGLSGPVYAYGPIARSRRGCTVCASRAPKGTFLAPPKAQRPRRRHSVGSRAVPQFTDAQVEVFRRIYEEKGVGVPAIAGLVWEKLGFRNQQSCSNAIHRALRAAGVTIRARGESHRRSVEATRFLGVGGFHPGEQRLTGQILDRLYELYKAGESVPELAAGHATSYGYSDLVRFRSVVEYGWKVCGYKLRSNREAELLSRAKSERTCVASTSTASGYRARPCPQRALEGSDYCYSHDPRNAEAIAATVARMQARIVRAPSLEFAEIRPHLDPLLIPRSRKEKASGALHRNTGVPGSVCSRLLNGSKKRLSVESANKILAPLGLSVDEIRTRKELAA